MENRSLVEELAGACVASVQNAIGVELDLTQDTLPVLDHYASLVESPTEEIMSLLAPMCGAYFGEVVRRQLGEGVWVCPEGDYRQWRLRFENCDLAFNPIGVALEVIANEEAPDWGGHLQTSPAHQKGMERAIEVLGEVRQNDYYRFAVRYEGVEQVYLALANKARADRLN